MLYFVCLCLITIVNFRLIKGEFSVPEPQFEAYEPAGFRVSIPADDGIQLFAFHGNLNKAITQIEPGEFNQDITKSENNVWSYYNKDLKLSIGDTLHYWVFVQHNYLGYRKVGSFKIEKLGKPSDTQCNAATTLVNGTPKGCLNQVIFEDDFGTPNVDDSKWTVEHYIPNQGPDYEFVSYQKSACATTDNKLVITPVVLGEEELKKSLDLKNGCTRTDIIECVQKFGAIFLPPVKSGKITSKFKFTYGTVEIRAKLPVGDWIYPEIYLEMDSHKKERIYIAYARGNNVLTVSGNDIGGTTLYGGPDTTHRINKFNRLISKKDQQPFTKDFHVYKVTWTPGKIQLFLDGAQYGEADVTPDFQKNAQLVLGVGVGGLNDFPEGSLSNGADKPWKNSERDMFKNFYNKKSIWQQTWSDASLQVEYIKIRTV